MNPVDVHVAMATLNLAYVDMLKTKEAKLGWGKSSQIPGKNNKG